MVGEGGGGAECEGRVVRVTRDGEGKEGSCGEEGRVRFGWQDEEKRV